MQNRAIEARALRHAGVSVQWISVAAQGVDHRLVLPILHLDGCVRRPIREGVGHGRALGTASEAAIAAKEERGAQREERRAVLSLDVGIGSDETALPLALHGHSDPFFEPDS